MERFHVVIVYKTLIMNSLFCVFTEDQGYGWHEECEQFSMIMFMLNVSTSHAQLLQRN